MPRFPLMPPPGRDEVIAARLLVTTPEAAQYAHPCIRQQAWHILGDELRQRRQARIVLLQPSHGGDAA